MKSDEVCLKSAWNLLVFPASRQTAAVPLLILHPLGRASGAHTFWPPAAALREVVRDTSSWAELFSDMAPAPFEPCKRPLNGPF